MPDTVMFVLTLLLAAIGFSCLVVVALLWASRDLTNEPPPTPGAKLTGADLFFLEDEVHAYWSDEDDARLSLYPEAQRNRLDNKGWA
jgi:hypothetical protein